MKTKNKNVSLKSFKLPKEINIKITRTEEGNYFAELLDYNAFTQAKSFEELPYLVNDLIYTYFDVPKKLQEYIWYHPKREDPLTRVENVSLPYQILFSEEYSRTRYYV